MTGITKKVLCLTTVYVVSIILSGCFKCDETLPYYDFKKLSFVYPNGTDELTEPFILDIIEDELEYLSRKSGFNLDLLPMAYALEPCPEPGYQGKKYEVTEIEIVSNADWDPLHPAGVLLNDLISIGFIRSDGWHFRSLSEVESFSSDHDGYHLMFPSPLLISHHTFTVKLIKSDGTEVVGSTEMISW